MGALRRRNHRCPRRAIPTDSGDGFGRGFGGAFGGRDGGRDGGCGGGGGGGDYPPAPAVSTRLDLLSA